MVAIRFVCCDADEQLLKEKSCVAPFQARRHLGGAILGLGYYLAVCVLERLCLQGSKTLAARRISSPIHGCDPTDDRTKTRSWSDNDLNPATPSYPQQISRCSKKIFSFVDRVVNCQDASCFGSGPNQDSHLEGRKLIRAKSTKLLTFDCTMEPAMIPRLTAEHARLFQMEF